MYRASDFHYAITEKDMTDFITRCMTKAGTAPEQIPSVVRMLLDADRRGHYSHGVNRLGVYVTEVGEGVCKAAGVPFVVKKKGGTALVDGDNALGPVVGEFCAQLAIDLARENGVAVVSASNSNHYGTAGRYAQMASDAGFIGLAFTNTSPCVFPTRSAEKALGTNPISFYAPAQGGDRFALDMATTTVAYGKVELVKRKGLDSIPQGWGADPSGVQTTDPDVVLEGGGGLLPLGGVEASGSYKGYGLSALVEILCGVLAGGHFGKNIRQWQHTHANADLGQCFIVIDPECFADGFAERLKQFNDEMRELEPTDASLPVHVPGDFSREHARRSAEAGGLLYHRSQVEYLNTLAAECKVDPVVTRPL